MKEKTVKTVRLVYEVIFGIYTAVVAALLIWQTVDLYRTGKASASGVIYSRQIVGERLMRLSPALWIWVALVIVGFGLGIAFATKQRVSKPDMRYSLYCLKKRVSVRNPESMSASVQVVRREETVLRILWLIVGAVGLAGTIYGIVYLCMPSHFPKTDVTHEMLAMAKNILPWVTWTFLLACGVGIYERFSARKQLPEVKKLVAASKSGDAVAVPASNVAGRVRTKAATNKFLRFLYAYRVWIARAVVGCVAIAFVIAGAFNGGARDVLIKAINICTECIGLG